MKKNLFYLWTGEEYQYSESYGFIPNIMGYLHDDETLRPCIVVVPGGGYRAVSQTEAEIVALDFYQKGYQVFVCTYTTNLLNKTPLKRQPMEDLSRAVRIIRKNCEELRIKEQQIILCGFSAGAHLCGSLCVHAEDIKEENVTYQGYSNKPDGAILSYPVITSGKYAHRDSFLALLGENASKEEMEYMSLEKQVTKETPPCFIWQTAEDELVPVENSYLMAEALRSAGVSYEHHVFARGEHGLSLANKDWAEGNFGTPYTMLQAEKIIEAIKRDQLKLSETEKRDTIHSFYENWMTWDPTETHSEIEIWTVLADGWIQQFLK